MDKLHKILAIVASILLIIGIFIGIIYLRAREDVVRAEERDKVTKDFLAQSAQERKDREQQQRERDAAELAYKQQQDARLADMAKTVALLKTPQQQVAWSQDQLKDALKGVQITVNPTTGEATATIPKESLSSLPQVIEQCKECPVKLDAAQHNVISLEQTVASLKVDKISLTKDNDALTKDNQSLKDAMKGGSFFHRTKRLVLDAACGAGGAAIGAGAANSKSKGAAIGAAVGVIGCAIANK
jgi:outer membrane PBP1 activator LpoA protein